MQFLFLLMACNDLGVSGGKPELVVLPGAVDFGESVITYRYEVELAVQNDGLGFVSITSASIINASSDDFSIGEYPTEPIGASDTFSMFLDYSPGYEGQDYGTLLLTTDQEDDPETTLDESQLQINLSGFGVKPVIELDPELLYFPDVPSGTSVSKTANLFAHGSGNLVIRHIEESDADGVFSYVINVPDYDATQPYTVQNGTSIPIDVTFSPNDDTEHSGQLTIDSNDPETQLANLELRGNAVDDPNENVCPVVQVLSPDNGEYLLSSTPVTLRGLVVDPDDSYSNLDCSWFANGSRLTSATVAGDGSIEDTANLPIGQIEVSLRCIDLAVCAGDDHSNVEVVDAEQPLRYTISGGDSVFDYLFVDDDISVYLNGTEIYADTDRTKSTLAPIEFEARKGDTIRIVATDVNSCMYQIDALQLHWGTGESQKLNDEACLSACPDDACYDASYNGPWPGIFLDENYEITIP